MPTNNAVVLNGTAVAVERSFTPDELGFNAVSLKANPTVAVGNVVDLQGFNTFMLTIIIDNTGGGTTGTYSATVDLLDEQNVVILSALSLFTAGNLKVDNTVTVVWGDAMTTAVRSGTATLGADVAILRFGSRFRLTLTNTEVSNGTTVTATCYLRART